MVRLDGQEIQKKKKSKSVWYLESIIRKDGEIKNDVWYIVGDAKDGCFSSLCMGELFRDTLFFDLEYGASLFGVAILEGTKYPHFWGCWEICWSSEVFGSWDIVWVVSYLGFYAMYFRIWFPAICFCFSVIFFFFFFCLNLSMFIIVNIMYFFFNENIYYL